MFVIVDDVYYWGGDDVCFNFVEVLEEWNVNVVCCCFCVCERYFEDCVGIEFVFVGCFIKF